MQWQRIEKPDFGYAVHVPQGWEERPPDLENSPWETARFGDPVDRRQSIIVFRHPVRPGRDAAEVAEAVQSTLEAAGYLDFRITAATVAGGPGARLDCARHDAGRVYAVREFFAVAGGASFCVGCGSTVPEQDDSLVVTIAERMELLDAG